jgi:hypothetical protein
MLKQMQNNEKPVPASEMTLLDYFAGQYMNAHWSANENGGHIVEVAERSYQQAAALIEERKKYIP